MKDTFDIEYPAVFEPQEEGGYTVLFPDLDGCITEGEDLEDAARNAQEALTGYLESLHGRGFQLPEPSDPKRLCGEVHMVTPELHVRLPLALRSARLRSGLSQQEVAKSVGTSYQNYQKWESPSSNVRARTIGRAFRAVGVDVRLGRAAEEPLGKKPAPQAARRSPKPLVAPKDAAETNPHRQLPKTPKIPRMPRKPE